MMTKSNMLYCTTFILKVKVYFIFEKLNQVKFIKFLEQSINKYNILQIPYENIFYYIFNDINIYFAC
jgi:hypothetical protein